jgi:hypothetical protein
MKDSDIIELFKDSQKAVKDTMDAHCMGIRATIKYEVDRIDEKLNSVIEHNKNQNGHFYKIDDELELNRPHHKFVHAITKKWITSVIVTVVILFLLNSLFEVVNLFTIIEWLTKIF